MGLLVGVTGLSTLDHVYRSARLSIEEGAFDIDLGGRRFAAPLSAPLGQSRKPEAWVGEDLLERADAVVPGGGALNACLALRSISRDFRLRYLDAGVPNPRVAQTLRASAIECRTLGLHKVPHNAVFGSRAAGNKWVLKSPLAGGSAAANVEARIRWLLECDAVLADSVKDRRLMTPLASAAARGRLRLYVVLSPTLSCGYMLDAVVPWASAVVAGIDEIGDALRLRIEPSLEGGMEALRIVSDYVQCASVYLTLGKDGLLVSDLATMTIYHVSLRGEVEASVQAALASAGLTVCGCGDAAAAGVLAYLEAGRSLLSGEPRSLPRSVAAAQAGTAAALRRLGFSRSLSPGDFVVRELGGPGGAWGRPSGAAA